MRKLILSALFFMTATSTAAIARGGLADVYSLSNGKDHMLTTSRAEIRSAERLGYRNQGVLFKIFTSRQPSTQALYRCLVDGDHFVSLDSNCEGESKEGIYGYLNSFPTDRTTEVIRCYNGKDHSVTTNYDCATGYHFESVLGHAITRGGNTRYGCDPQKIMWDDYGMVNPRNRRRNDICSSRIGSGYDGDIERIWDRNSQDGWIELECVEGEWEVTSSRRGRMNLECNTGRLYDPVD